MSIRDLAKRWKEIQESDLAVREDDFTALKSMPQDDLLRLAWDALTTVKAIDDEGYDYLMDELKDSLEGPGDHQSFWCISQADKTGGFNKWCKTIGGYLPESGPSGDVLLFSAWKDAKAALDFMNKDVGNCFRIYPVVACAGREPRTTEPKGHYGP